MDFIFWDQWSRIEAVDLARARGHCRERWTEDSHAEDCLFCLGVNVGIVQRRGERGSEERLGLERYFFRCSCLVAKRPIEARAG